MRRISTKTTFYFKRLFPIFWFGLIAFSFVMSLIVVSRYHGFPIAVIIIPVVMAIVGYIVMKRLVFDLVDEVWDAGDELVVKNKGEEARIPLSNIINVGYSIMVNPSRITLMLRTPCRFGKEISFSPPQRFAMIISRNPLIDELIERIEEKRRVGTHFK